jgi:hypothetical protein
MQMKAPKSSLCALFAGCGVIAACSQGNVNTTPDSGVSPPIYNQGQEPRNISRGSKVRNGRLVPQKRRWTVLAAVSEE